MKIVDAYLFSNKTNGMAPSHNLAARNTASSKYRLSGGNKCPIGTHLPQRSLLSSEGAAAELKMKICTCTTEDDERSVKCIVCKVHFAIGLKDIALETVDKLGEISSRVSDFERRSNTLDGVGGIGSNDVAISPRDLELCLQPLKTTFETSCRHYKILVGSRFGRTGFETLLGEEESPEDSGRERLRAKSSDPCIAFQLAHKHKYAFSVCGKTLRAMNKLMVRFLDWCDITKSHVEICGCVGKVTPCQIKSQKDTEGGVVLETDTIVVDMKQLEEFISEIKEHFYYTQAAALLHFGVEAKDFDPYDGWHMMTACQYVQKNNPGHPVFLPF